MNMLRTLFQCWKRISFQQAANVLEKGRYEEIVQEDFLDFNASVDTDLKNSKFLERCRQKRSQSILSLITDLLVVAKWDFVAVCVLSAMALIASLFVPIYLTELLHAIETHNLDSNQQQTIVSAAILFVTLFLRSFLNAHTQFKDQSYQIVARQMIVNAILTKIIDVGGESLDEKDSGRVQNLIHADSNHLANLPTTVFHFILTSVQLAAFTGMLFSLMGPSTIFGILCLVLALVVQSKIMKYLSTKMHEINELKDERISITSELFRKIKLVRMSGLSARFARNISNVREGEIRLLFQCNVVYLFSQVLMLGAPLFMAVVTFSIYLLQENELTITKIFSVIALFSMIRNPMLGLSATLYEINGATISTRRIRDFLNRKYEPIDIKDSSIEYGAIFAEGVYVNLNGRAILSDVNIHINPGELIAVTGNTGSGKSSLLNLLAGYYSEFDGTVARNGSLTHLQHYMWLANDTIRNNILFGKPFRAKRYQKVIENCQLTWDLNQLSSGDQTIVGELGAKLSGGQQQRIALARAIYADPDILLLDNPLSALDPKVAEMVVAEAIVPLSSKTILIVTNDPNIVSHCDRCFNIQQGYVREVKIATAVKEKSATVHKEDSLESDHAMSFADLFEEESVQKGNVKWTLIKEVMSQTGSGALLLMTFLGLGLIEVLRLLSEYWLANQTIVQSGSVGETLATYSMMSGLGLLFVIISQFLVCTRTINFTRVSHEKMLSRVLGAPMSFFERVPQGRIVNRFSSDIDVCSGELLGNLSATVTLGLALLAQVMFVCLQMPEFSIVVGVMCILYWRLQKLFRFSSRNLQRTLSVLRSPFYSSIAEFVRSAPALRLHNVENYALGRAMNLLCINQKGQYTKSVLNGWLSLRQSMLSVLVTGFVIVLVVESGSEVLGALAVTYAVLASSTITQFLNNLVVVEGDMNAAWRVGEYCCLEQESSDKDHHYRIPDKYRISIKSTNFSYPQSGNPVLHDVSFSIEEGAKVGVCGRTGSGKSSLISILLRLYPVTSGRISIGNVPSDCIELEKQRSMMSVITQTPLLYSGSIAENIDPYGKYNEETIRDVLEQLGISERVREFDHGLATDISTPDLSAGEKQLLVVARTVLVGAPILLLDEAFSDLDSSLTASVSAFLYKSKATILLVSHHLQSLLDMDKVLVFDNGKLIEQGAPGDLIIDERSQFYKLFRRQIGLYTEVTAV